MTWIRIRTKIKWMLSTDGQKVTEIDIFQKEGGGGDHKTFLKISQKNVSGVPRTFLFSWILRGDSAHSGPVSGRGRIYFIPVRCSF